ncbi:MBL fold metallo-hydrolase [Paramesorhizobium deserti]|uniref:MBL fold metallo-hydrolase n=1 Tax=Paramesorhizobium deserti TaxID=1494590 RepID=A0A135HR09_9HYPH|nr:MBL fold metallo-hydrolase [Paramesorhizobium deserti]KXF75620.1 MBL fold metallo-hydrolase [Paramesorhizobium deserti]
MYTRRNLLRGAAALAVLSTGMSGFGPALAKAPFQTFQAPGFYRLRLGRFEVTALSDGTVPLPLPELYTNTTSEHARSALAAAFQETPTQTSVNAFLVNAGDRLVLIDAGTGSYLGPTLGKLMGNLKAAGYQPDQIDDIILTHIHTDHSGGLSAEGDRLFRNATVRVNERELDFWLKTPVAERPASAPPQHFTEAHESLQPYLDAGRIETFADNGEVLPGIGSILRAGHTPGHSSIVIEDGGRKLVFWGDITHGDALQFDEPGVAIEFDVDQKKAVETRAVALDEAASERYMVAGAHIAFPGIGHVRRDETNYDWVPLNYSASAG